MNQTSKFLFSLPVALRGIRFVLAFFSCYALLSASTANAASTPIGDFRLNANPFSGGFTYFDPGFGSLHGESPLMTRGTIGSPVTVNSDFSGTSQDEGNAPVSDLTDVGLRTYSSATVIRTINRYAQDTTQGTGTDDVGAVQWSFDLTPVDSYLSSNSLSLSALDLDFITDPSDDDKPYDVYLSYTDAGIALTDISISARTNHNNMWVPAQASAEGDVVGGMFEILELQHAGDLALNQSLLSLYNSGVREFNLIMSSGAFFSGRTIGIQAGSGLSIDTQPSTGISGDFDGNSDYDCGDLDSLSSEIAAGTNGASFDLTGDGFVTIADRDAWLAEAGTAELNSGNPYFASDLNLDGNVTSTDLGELLSNFGATTGVAHCDGDINADSIVDSSDLGQLLTEFGSSAALSTAAVPEPGSCVLLSIAAFAMLFARRKNAVCTF